MYIKYVYNPLIQLLGNLQWKINPFVTIVACVGRAIHKPSIQELEHLEMLPN